MTSHARILSRYFGLLLTRTLSNASCAVGPVSCYKFGMSKIVEQWLLFKYVGLEFAPLSNPFKRENKRRRSVRNILSVCARRLGSV